MPTRHSGPRGTVIASLLAHLTLGALAVALARLHVGVRLAPGEHGAPGAARWVDDPDRAYAWYGALAPGEALYLAFAGTSGGRFRARAYAPSDDPRAPAFHPALVLSGPGIPAPDRPPIPLAPGTAGALVVTPDPALARPERRFHSGRAYLQGVGLDLRLPAAGDYVLALVAGETGGAFMLGTGWRED